MSMDLGHVGPGHTSRSRAVYVPDHKSFGRLMVSKQVLDPVMSAARLIRGIAAATAEVDTGDYASGFRTTVGGILIIDGNPRVYGVVYNEDDASLENEYGTHGRQGPRTLGAAGAAVGQHRNVAKIESWGGMQ